MPFHIFPYIFYLV